MSAWTDGQRDEWGPDSPNGDMAPLLERSIDAVKARHPSYVVPDAPLTLLDRCDACGAATAYRVHRPPTHDRTAGVLDFCGHHYRKNTPQLIGDGWAVAVTNESG